MENWPELRLAEWEPTLTTLHLWTQIVGKIRLRCVPFINHWWNVTLYVSPHGLTTGPMPHSSGRSFSIDFDFVRDELAIEDSGGARGGFSLEPMTVADFYRRLMQELRRMGLDVVIVAKPNEVPDAIPFAQDVVHGSYDREHVHRYFRILLNADRIFTAFRSNFIGKSSPVHFFWGAFDLAVSRFSGRVAPPHPGGMPNMPDAAMRAAYSHEVQSVGLWFGGNGAEAMFYSYGYPVAEGLETKRIRPDGATWSTQFREFVLPYEAVRTSSTPDDDVRTFLESSYEAAAESLAWDRRTLEQQPVS